MGSAASRTTTASLSDVSASVGGTNRSREGFQLPQVAASAGITGPVFSPATIPGGIAGITGPARSPALKIFAPAAAPAAPVASAAKPATEYKAAVESAAKQQQQQSAETKEYVVPVRPNRLGDPVSLEDPLVEKTQGGVSGKCNLSGRGVADDSGSIYTNRKALQSLYAPIDGKRHCLEAQQRQFVDDRARCRADRNRTFVCHGLYGGYEVQSEFIPESAEAAQWSESSVSNAARYDGAHLDNSQRTLDRLLTMRQSRAKGGHRPTMLESTAAAVKKSSLAAPLAPGALSAVAPRVPLRPSAGLVDDFLRAGSEVMLLQHKQAIQEHAEAGSGILLHAPVAADTE